MKNIRDFYLKIFSFLGVIFSIYLNRHVFVMFYSLSVSFFLPLEVSSFITGVKRFIFATLFNPSQKLN